jgi:hypothetical protein
VLRYLRLGLLGEAGLGAGLGLLDASSGTLLLVELGGGLLQLLELDRVPRDGLLLVSLIEDLASPVSAGTLGNAELVALEVGRGHEGLLGSNALGGGGGVVLLEGLLLTEGRLEGCSLGVAANGEVELQGLDVLHVLDVAPHLVVLRVLDEHAGGIDDISDDADLIGTGATDDADEAADADVVRVHHCCGVGVVLEPWGKK